MKNKKTFSAIILTVAILSVSALTTSAVYAAALTQAQISAIVGLLQSFGAEQSIINNVQVSLSGGTPSVSTTPTTISIPPISECYRLSTGMWVGLSDREAGNEVSRLQKFLRAQGDFTYSEITGFYGPATEEAVRRFQSRSGIVSGGNAETTGYGVVGSFTRAKITEISCGNIVPLPTPIPTPIPTPVPSNLEVISPNGGETWQKGTTQLIRWAQRSVSVSPASPAETSAVSGNTSTSVMPPISLSPVIFPVNISLTSYTPPCTVGPCPAMPTAIYLIASNAPNTGEYRWTVGATTNSNTTIPDGVYMMRVCAGNQCDQSNSYFKIVSQGANLPPVIDGVSGPTVLDVGQLGTWSVRAHDPENGPLSYIVNWGDDVSSGSAGGGTSPMSISASQTTTFTHNYSRAGAYKVGFTVTDSKGLTAQSSISVNVGAAQPLVTVLNPNGGESFSLNADGRIAVNYKLTNARGPIYLYLLNSSGTVVSTQSTEKGDPNGANTFYFPIAPAVIVSGVSVNNQYKFKVCDQGSDIINPACDSSDNYFTITSNTPQPSITVLSPNGGEMFTEGSQASIRWNTSGLSSSQKLNIVLNVGLSGPGKIIANDVINTGSYLWTVKSLEPFYASEGGSWIVPNGQYTISVICSQQNYAACNFNRNFGVSASTFTITKQNSPPPLSIIVQSPNGGEVWKDNISEYIYFTSNLSKQTVKIWAQNTESGLVTIINESYVTRDSNPNLAGWSPSLTPLIVGNYKICVGIDVKNPLDCSNTTFAVVASTSTTQPSITVLSPNGGESYQTNGSMGVAWSQNNAVGPVRIHLINYPNNVEYYVSGVFEGGSNKTGVTLSGEALNVPSGQYRIQICDEGVKGAVCDESDSYFTITAPTNSVTLSPGNDHYFTGTGSLKEISDGGFADSLTVGNRVDELLTFDGIPPATSESASGVYYRWQGAWRKVGLGATVIDQNTLVPKYFIIRRNSGQSGAFALMPHHVYYGSTVKNGTPRPWGTTPQPSITVLSPNGGESWVYASNQQIRWYSTGVPPTQLITIGARGMGRLQ